MRWRPLWVALGWALVGAIVWLSLTTAPVQIDVAQGDKLGHFTGYGTLMFWFCQLHAARPQRIAYGLAWVALGVSLEFLQGWLGWRSYDPWDMAANTTGVALGWIAAVAIGARVFGWVERLAAR